MLLVVSFVEIPLLKTAVQLRVVVVSRLVLHLEDLLAQGQREGGGNLCRLWFLLLVKLLFQLLHFHKTLLSVLLFGLHDQLLASLLSYVCRVQLGKLILIIFEKRVLLLLGHFFGHIIFL